MTTTSTENDSFWREYISPDAIRTYSRTTAGSGISYLLDHDYRTIYLEAIRLLPADLRRQGIRILEFGCGPGMNLLHLIGTLGRDGIQVESGIGSDFSPVLIDAAKLEAKNYLREEDQRKVRFCQARNETLIQDLSAGLGKQRAELENSFHFVFGVNTTRYTHRLHKQAECARDIFDLLVPGGVCVMIDMNKRFPVFRSAVRARLRGQERNQEECYLPSLDEYAEPFTKTGFELVRKEHFCWIPHSAGKFMTHLLSGLTPLLNSVAKSRAMRSLVVARKPSR